MQAYVRPFAGPASVIGWLGCRLTTIAAARAHDRRVRSVIDELEGLGDRELDDLGIGRGAIADLAAQAVAEGSTLRALPGPSALDRATLWVARRLASLAEAIEARRSRVATVRRLKALSLRELEDIGLAPFEIPEAAANAVALRSAANADAARPAVAANAA